MSVLKNKRGESRAEFVNVANQIFTETLTFMTKLSSRYARLLSSDTIRLASEVLDNCEKANSIYPHDEQRMSLRAAHLIEARASLMALDVHMAHCYQAMMLNPEGCFTTSSGRTVTSSDAKRKLERMAESLGSLIDHENNLLIKVMNSDKNRNKK